MKNYSLKFRRRIGLFKEFLKNSYSWGYPCDFDNFTGYVIAIRQEIKDMILEGETSEGMVSEWLNYEEAVKFVEEHMINDLEWNYFDNCSGDY